MAQPENHIFFMNPADFYDARVAAGMAGHADAEATHAANEAGLAEAGVAIPAHEVRTLRAFIKEVSEPAKNDPGLAEHLRQLGWDGASLPNQRELQTFVNEARQYHRLSGKPKPASERLAKLQDEINAATFQRPHKEFDKPSWVRPVEVIDFGPKRGKHAGEAKAEIQDALSSATEKAIEAAAKAADVITDPENRQKVIAGAAAVALGVGLVPKPNDPPRANASVVAHSDRPLLAAGNALSGSEGLDTQAAAGALRAEARAIAGTPQHPSHNHALQLELGKVTAYNTAQANRLHPEAAQLHQAGAGLIGAIAAHPGATSHRLARELQATLPSSQHQLEKQFVRSLHEIDPRLPHRSELALAVLMIDDIEASIGHDLHAVHVTKPHHNARLTPHEVQKILPAASLRNIEAYTPLILQALHKRGLTGPHIIAYAFATLNAETSRLASIPEYGSGAEYQGNKILGNIHPGDGERYKGRGFLQLTGYDNYLHYGQVLGIDLIHHPNLALQPKIAAEIFAEYIYEHKQHIMQPLKHGNLAAARAVVNGGTNGLEAFAHSYRIAMHVIAPAPAPALPTPVETVPAQTTTSETSSTTASSSSGSSSSETQSGTQSTSTTFSTSETTSSDSSASSEADTSSSDTISSASSEQTASLEQSGQAVCDGLGIPFLGVQDGYHEGSKVPVALCEISGQPVNVGIAKNLLDMFAAAKADGINFTITLGFRSQGKQIELRQENGCGDIYDAPASSCKVPTARPGYSEHQMGNAVDLGVDGVPMTNADSEALRWLQTHAADYGFHDLTGEGWHWSVDGH